MCVKQELQEFADIDDIATLAESDMQEVDISDFTESVEDSNLTDQQLYRKQFLQDFEKPFHLVLTNKKQIWNNAITQSNASKSDENWNTE